MAKKGKAHDESNGVLNLLSLEFKYCAAIVILLIKLNEYEMEGAIPYIGTIDKKQSTLLRIDWLPSCFGG